MTTKQIHLKELVFFSIFAVFKKFVPNQSRPEPEELSGLEG